MSVVQLNKDPSRKQLNQFGFIWLGFLAFFGVIAYFKLQNQTLAFVLWGLSIAVPAVGWLVPAVMRVVFLGLSYAAWPIGFVVSHVILALVYYLVVTPIGLLMRIFGYDPMGRRFDPETASYWVRREESGTDSQRYFRQF